MILLDNKVVIAIMDDFEQLENGKLINGVIYPMGDVIKIDPPSHIIAGKYCYTEKDGFYINQEWEQSVEMETQLAIDKYTMELIEGGLL